MIAGTDVIIGVGRIKLGARVRVQASEVIPVMEPLGGKESADLLN